MGRMVREYRLETREARIQRKPRQNPYWRLLSTNVHLGYRKGSRGGVWYFRVFHEGNYIKRTFAQADDFAEANGKTILTFSQAQDYVRKAAEKIFRGNDLDETKAYTVRDAITDYLADFKANGKKSLYATETQIKAHILPTFGDKIISNITYNQLNSWKNKLATTHKRTRTGLGDNQQFKVDENNDPEYQRRRRSTANRIITILKAILNHAFQSNRVKSNETWQKLKPFKNVSEPKIRFLDEKESLRLLNACDLNFRLLVRGALLTGARYGELTSLKAGDYSHDNKTLFIHQSKSGKSRHIPLNQEGINFFEQQIAGKSTQEFIFIRGNNSQWKKNYQVRPLEAACRAAKIIPAINFHILRHTYGSALAMKGVPLQVISAVLGHSDTRVTSRHYAHLMPSYIADVIREHLPNYGKTETNNVKQIKQAINTFTQ